MINWVKEGWGEGREMTDDDSSLSSLPNGIHE